MTGPFLLAVAFASVVPADSSELAPADRHALLELASRMDSAWTAADAEANAELFTRDATARFGEDPLGQGRDEIRAQFKSFFKERPSGLRHLTTIERIEPIDRDRVLWDAEIRVEAKQPQGTWVSLTRIRNVTLAVRQPDGWRIHAVRAFPVR